MERAFDAPKGLQTPLHGHTLLLGCLSLIFFKKINTSPRQINSKIQEFERGHSYQVLFGVYLVFIWLGTWLGESVTKKLIENMFSGRRTLVFLRQTRLSNANGGVCHGRPTDATTVSSNASVTKASSRLSTMEELLTTSDRR
jgi:hypothetical protein